VSLCALVSGASCTTPREPALDVSVAPSGTSLIVGQTAQLTVIRHFSGGPFETVTDRVDYETTNRNVATVSDKGIILGGPDGGNVIIRVHDRASDAVVSLTFDIVAVRLQSISVTPSPAVVMRPGAQRQFNATAHLNNGLSKDVTAEVIWSSSNDLAAVVGKAQNDHGVVYAIAEGDATIAATDPATLIEGLSSVSVHGDTLTPKAIVVAPNPATVRVGETVQLAAAAIFSDGTSSDVSGIVSWFSSATSIATVDAKGLATGVSAGSTTITATNGVATPDAGAGQAFVKGSTAVTVTKP
jgi:uncharacterized protein YjdB